MTDSMGPVKLVRHEQSLSNIYDTDFICMGLGPNISSVIAKSLVYAVIRHMEYEYFGHKYIYALRLEAMD